MSIRSDIAAVSPHLVHHTRPLLVRRDRTRSGVNRNYTFQVLRTGFFVFLIDLAAYLLCLIAAFMLAKVMGATLVPFLNPITLIILFGLPASSFVMGLFCHRGLHPLFELRQFTIGISLAFVLTLIMTLGSAQGYALLIGLAFAMIVVPTLRKAGRQGLAQTQFWGVNCLVFDCDRRINSLYSQHLQNKSHGLIPVGFIQDKLPSSCKEEFKAAYRGTADNSAAIAEKLSAHCAIVHRRGRHDREISKYIESRLQHFAQVIVVPDDNRQPSLWS